MSEFPDINAVLCREKHTSKHTPRIKQKSVCHATMSDRFRKIVGMQFTVVCDSGRDRSFGFVLSKRRRVYGAALYAVVVAQNDNVDATIRDSRITFTVTQTNYYATFARSVPTTAVGAYTLTIQ